MRSRLPASLMAIALLIGLALPAAVAGSSDRTSSVIVLFEDTVRDPGATARQLAASHGFTTRHVYTTAVNGFVAAMSAEAVHALRAHPQIARVEAEAEERLVGDVPTGVDRIETDKNPGAGIDGTTGPDLAHHVAVIDTGISPHSDLRIGAGASFAGGDTSDGNGHGTHVAGTIAARDNGSGVVGVAPGAWVHPVKVCKNGGICLSGDIVAGIDWVAAQKKEFKESAGASGIDFASANFSISSSDSNNSCSSPANATHAAICGVVAEGVVFAMAAGNDARAKTAYPVAFTVAAIADFDGKGGGAGASTCRSDEDDTLASFSNWGVDIAAPGTCITSTWNDGGYNTISGTSMATPHVAGAVALYLHANGFAPKTDATGVSQIEAAIVGGAIAEGTEADPCGYVNERGSDEPLLFVNSSAFKGDGACDFVSGGGGGGGGTSGTSHVGDLSQTSAWVNSARWSATVSILVHDQNHDAVDAATVTGSWSGGASGAASCTTDASGSCTVETTAHRNSSSVTFTVTDISHASLTYEDTENHETSIEVTRPT